MNSQYGGDLYKCLVRQRADLMGLAFCIPELKFEKIEVKFPGAFAFSKNEKFNDLAGLEFEALRFFDEKSGFEIDVPFTREELRNSHNDDETAKILAKVVKTHRELVNYYLRTRGMDPAKHSHLFAAHKLCVRHLRNAYLNWYSISNKDNIRAKFYGADQYLKDMRTIAAMSYLPATELFYEVMTMPASVPSELLMENVSKFSFFISQRPDSVQTFFEHRLTKPETGMNTAFIVDTLRDRFIDACYHIGRTPYSQMKTEESWANAADEGASD